MARGADARPGDTGSGALAFVRIGLLTTSYPRVPGDVPGIFVRGFAAALAARGHRIDVLAPQPAERFPPPGEPGIAVQWVPYLRPRRWQRTFYGAGVPDNLRRDPVAWLGLAPFTAALSWHAKRARDTWDAVVSHWALPCALAASCARSVGKRDARAPHLAVLHSADVHLLGRLHPLVRSRMADRIARTSDHMLFVSPRLRDVFLASLPAAARDTAAPRAHVAPMGIEPCSGPPAEDDGVRELRGARGLVLLSVGRLVPIKGVDVLIRAVAGLPAVRLWVVGDGPERTALERLAKRLNADVRFLGQQTGEAKHRLMHAADLFVSASRPLASGRTEGMPTAVLEALRCGLPVVATRTGGTASLLGQGEHAALVEPASAATLRHAILELQEAPEQRARLAGNGRMLARQHTWTALAPRVEGWLRAECGGCPSAGSTRRPMRESRD